MGLNERFLENEQNISALKIHRTGISVLLLICMWISLLDCGWDCQDHGCEDGCI